MDISKNSDDKKRTILPKSTDANLKKANPAIDGGEEADPVILTSNFGDKIQINRNNSKIHRFDDIYSGLHTASAEICSHL